MGFSSGKSKAKRKAKKQAASQYIDAIRKAEFGGEEVPKIDERGKRRLEREYGDAGLLGGRERRLARQADRVADKANEVRGEYNQKLEKYNKRREVALAQLENRVASTKDPKRLAAIDAEIGKLKAEEAAFRKTQPRQQNNYGMLWNMGIRQPEAPLNEAQISRAKRLSELQADRRLYSGDGFQRAQGYRELGGLEDAYNDLAIMAKEAQGYRMKETPRAAAAKQNEYRGLLDTAVGANQKPTGWMGLGVGSSGTAWNGMGGPALGTQLANGGFAMPAPKAKPEDMVLDQNSAAVKLKSKVATYNGIAEKLKQNLKRKAQGGLAGTENQELAGAGLAGEDTLAQERLA